MGKWLCKCFIKDYQDTRKESVRSAYGILSAWVGLFVNLLLFLGKGALALVLASKAHWILPMALLSDAVDNGGDMASNIVTLVGFKAANKPADKDHPFGHERVEYIAGLIVSLFVLFASFSLIKSSISSLIEGASVSYSYLSLILLGVGILLKVWLGFFYLSMAKAIQSPSLKATAIDSFTDCLASFSVMLSATLGLTLGWTFLDGYFGIAVALFVLYSAIMMLKETIAPLIGVPFSRKDVEEIENMAKKHPEIRGVHDVIFHRYGPTKTYISLHAEVDPKMSLLACHEVLDSLEDEINARFGAESTIHADPCEESDEELCRAKEALQGVLSSFGLTSTLHDVHIHHGQTPRLEADVVLVYGQEAKEDEILQAAKAALPSYEICLRFDLPLAK